MQVWIHPKGLLAILVRRSNYVPYLLCFQSSSTEILFYCLKYLYLYPDYKDPKNKDKDATISKLLKAKMKNLMLYTLVLRPGPRIRCSRISSTLVP